MRVLMTTDTVGGVWTFSTELTQGLLEKDVAVALVTVGRAPSAQQAQWLCHMKPRWKGAFVYEATTIPLEWMNNNERAYLDGEPVLLRVAEEFGAEVLHSNQYCFGALPLPIPTLLAAHSDVLSWAASCRDQAMPNSPWLDRYRALVTAGLRRAAALVAPTRWMLNAFTAGFHVSCATYVVPNGRTIEVTHQGSTRKLQAVTAGRLWDEAKNLAMLANAQIPFPLLVAGEVAHEANTCPALPAGAMALGPLSEQDLLQLFQESAIYLCTSRYEPFGLAPLEAALCGCAIVANDTPSLREVWGDAALYFRDAAELTNLLRILTLRPEQLRAAQIRSRQRASMYSAAQMTEHYLAIYQGMLGEAEASIRVA